MSREDEIRVRYDATTHGEWYYDGMHPEIQNFEGDKFWLICSELRQHPGDKIPEDEFGHVFNADFEFMAHAHEDIPYLLSENARLHAELTMIRHDIVQY